jgi:shikimate 5-dehydrogenase
MSANPWGRDQAADGWAALELTSIDLMTNPERAPHAKKPDERVPEKPFADHKVPVCEGLAGFEVFMEQYPRFTFCPYVADKDAEGWDKSTSRVYMNQVFANFLYVPVNIAEGNEPELRRFFEYSNNAQAIAAVNITQPHKSNRVLRELFLDDPRSDDNIDTLIRGANGNLLPYDLNSAAFVEWFKDEVGEFCGKPVVLVGIGGVGEPIAKRIAAEKPARLLLMDVSDKGRSRLAKQLNAIVPTTFVKSLQSVLHNGALKGGIVINAAGKEGAASDSELRWLINAGADNGLFVDIRPNLAIDIVEQAKRHGWRAYTGHQMNARNDYVLLQAIAAQIQGALPLAFEQFRHLVARAS